jgi:hypothetical protein
MLANIPKLTPFGQRRVRPLDCCDFSSACIHNNGRRPHDNAIIRWKHGPPAPDCKHHARTASHKVARPPVAVVRRHTITHRARLLRAAARAYTALATTSVGPPVNHADPPHVATA